MRSMTGFGVGAICNENLSVQVELKSVNGKFLDISMNMPRSYSGFENIVQTPIKKQPFTG